MTRLAQNPRLIPSPNAPGEIKAEFYWTCAVIPVAPRGNSFTTIPFTADKTEAMMEALIIDMDAQGIACDADSFMAIAASKSGGGE